MSINNIIYFFLNGASDFYFHHQIIGPIIYIQKYDFPIRTQRRFNVHTTSLRRPYDVETTLCAYRARVFAQHHFSIRKTSQSSKVVIFSWSFTTSFEFFLIMSPWMNSQKIRAENSNPLISQTSNGKILPRYSHSENKSSFLFLFLSSVTQ